MVTPQNRDLIAFLSQSSYAAVSTLAFLVLYSLTRQNQVINLNFPFHIFFFLGPSCKNNHASLSRTHYWILP